MTQADTDYECSRSRPYGLDDRAHLQHVHLFASDIDATIEFYRRWFDARVVWDGDYGGARNVFIMIGIGAMHLYEQPPRDLGRNAVHHLGMQVVGLHDIYARMKAAGIELPNPIREHSGGGYFMVKAPDDVLLEVFEPGTSRDPVVLAYYGLGTGEEGDEPGARRRHTKKETTPCCEERSSRPRSYRAPCWLRRRTIPPSR